MSFWEKSKMLKKIKRNKISYGVIASIWVLPLNAENVLFYFQSKPISEMILIHFRFIKF